MEENEEEKKEKIVHRKKIKVNAVVSVVPFQKNQLKSTCDQQVFTYCRIRL